MSWIYMYVPWEKDLGIVNGAQFFISRIEYRIEKKLKNYDDATVVANDGLHEVANDDILYIAGHGAKNDENIYGSLKQKMTAGSLAKQLNDNNLNKGHQKIKVWVCYSGYGMHMKQGLAYKLWKEMHDLGYKKLEVYGYVEAILDPLQPTDKHNYAASVLQGFQSLFDTPEKLKILPGSAQHWRIGIDASGNLIPPRKLPRSLG